MSGSYWNISDYLDDKHVWVPKKALSGGLQIIHSYKERKKSFNWTFKISTTQIRIYMYIIFICILKCRGPISLVVSDMTVKL